MTTLFETILNLTLTGSVVIAIVLLARMLMVRFPKKYSYMLWAVAAFKLLCPKTPRSILSVFNLIRIREIGATSAPAVHSLTAVRPVAVASKAAAPAMRPAVRTAEVAVSKAPEITIWNVFAVIWITGMIIITTLILVKTIMLVLRLRKAQSVDGKVYYSPNVSAPFVFGLLRPRIYMPIGLSEDEYHYLLLHEQTHIRRKDMIFKAVGIITLIVHWFNPLVWVAFRFFEKDMEMSCDEAVIKNISKSVRADYCESLVTYARKSTVPKYLVLPLSFGKKDIKARIKNIMKYKKLTMPVTVASLALVAIVATGCFFSPSEKKVVVESKEQTGSVGLDNLAFKGTEETADETEATEPSETTLANTEVVPYEGLPITGDYYIQNGIIVQGWDEPGDYLYVPYEAVELPDGALFELDLPKPDGCGFDLDANVAKGTVLDSKSIGGYYTLFTTWDGGPTDVDTVFIVTDRAFSDEEVSAYEDKLNSYGFIEDTNFENDHYYSGHTEDGMSVVVEKFDYDDGTGFISVRFYGSNAFGNSLGLG